MGQSNRIEEKISCSREERRGGEGLGDFLNFVVVAKCIRCFSIYTLRRMHLSSMFIFIVVSEETVGNLAGYFWSRGGWGGAYNLGVAER